MFLQRPRLLFDSLLASSSKFLTVVGYTTTTWYASLFETLYEINHTVRLIGFKPLELVSKSKQLTRLSATAKYLQCAEYNKG